MPDATGCSMDSLLPTVDPLAVEKDGPPAFLAGRGGYEEQTHSVNCERHMVSIGMVREGKDQMGRGFQENPPSTAPAARR